jgi:AhpD family alkylhydroperoxidase
LLSRATRRTTQAQIRHVSPVPPGSAQGLVAKVYAQLERDFGMLAPPVTLHAVAPEALAAAWLMLRETLLAAAPVRRAEREAVAVAVSRTNACPYCVEVHRTVLHGLVGAGDAAAIGRGQHGSVVDTGLQRRAQWVAQPGQPLGPAALAAELLGTAVTFHYLNRMVNVFLVESPLPPGVPATARRMIMGLAAAILRPVVRRSADPGGSLDLLPAADLPADLGWAAGTPTIGAAFGRAAAALEAAGARSVPDRVRELVMAELSGWDGRPLGLAAPWVRQRVAALPAAERPAGRLALLSAVASYQVGPSVVEEFRHYRPDDQSLVEVVAWASMAAARRWGAGRWSQTPAGD